MKSRFDTVTFKCPWCGNLCAFKQSVSGKRAECLKCRHRFVIPAEDGLVAIKVKEEVVEDDGDVTSGFYEAVKSPKVFFSNRANITGIAYLISLTVLKFIFWNFNFELSYFVAATGKVVTIPMMVGRGISIIALGMIFKVYLDTVYAVAYEQDDLPELEIGFGFDFIFNFSRSLYVFILSMSFAQLPTLLLMLIMRLGGFWNPVVLWSLFGVCTLIFPMLLLMGAVSQDIFCFHRIDLAVMSIKKVLPQYCICTLFVGSSVIGGIFCKQFSISISLDSALFVPLYLFGNILVTLLGLYAARVLGLMQRHYGGLMKW